MLAASTRRKSQEPVALFADPTHPLLSSGGVLARNQSEIAGDLLAAWKARHVPPAERALAPLVHRPLGRSWQHVQLSRRADPHCARQATIVEERLKDSTGNRFTTLPDRQTWWHRSSACLG